MSHDLRDLRTKVHPRTARWLKADARILKKDESRVAADILDEYYESRERVAIEARRLEETEGESGRIREETGRRR